MNHRHWHPDPHPSHVSPHILNANGWSIARLHLQFIISWLFEGTLFTVWLSISTQRVCPQRNKLGLQHCICPYWHRNVARGRGRGLPGAPQNQTDGATKAQTRLRCRCEATCEASAERWQAAPGQITSDSSFQMPLVKVSIYMSNLSLPARAPVDYSLPSLKSLARLGWLLLPNWNVAVKYNSPTARKRRRTLIYNTSRSLKWQVLYIL